MSSDSRHVPSEVKESTRPALVKLTNDLDGMRISLLQGFRSRKELLYWMQRLTIRTLGELPDRWYFDLASEFRGDPSSTKDRALLACLKSDWHRKRDDICEDDALEVRERLCALTVRPAYHAAFRKLRRDAGEYVDSDTGDASAHDANIQRYIAMRPAIDELERYQQRALEQLIGILEAEDDNGGLEDRSSILEWGNDVELATHGELPEAFIARCYRESSTVEMLTGDEPEHLHARELFAAHHLAPYFNRGVRDLSGRATEQPEGDAPEREVPFA